MSDYAKIDPSLPDRIFKMAEQGMVFDHEIKIKDQEIKLKEQEIKIRSLEQEELERKGEERIAIRGQIYVTVAIGLLCSAAVLCAYFKCHAAATAFAGAIAAFGFIMWKPAQNKDKKKNKETSR